MLKTFLDVFSSEVATKNTLDGSCSMMFKFLFVIAIDLVLGFSLVFESRLSWMVGVETQTLFATRQLNDIAHLAFAFNFMPWI